MSHFTNITTILIWSQDFKQLAKWYEQTFDLQTVEKINHPDDTGVLFELPGGKPWIWIGQHSKVKGKSENPHRIMFNIEVDSVQATYEHLLSKGATFFAKPFKAPTFDKYFATLEDLDGNFIQIVGPY
jgi:uncharacterized glyoxalase superfamily protein PhnB